MQRIIIGCLLIIGSTSSCIPEDDQYLMSFRVYCEMVANGAKPIALSDPMKSNDLDLAWNSLLETAGEYDLQLYREDSFPSTLLFPAELTENQSVVVIYRGESLTRYLQWKEDLPSGDPIEMARRFGRLLGYDNFSINKLLAENSEFKSLAMFGVGSQITHLYYENVEEAITFYSTVLGLPVSNSNTFRVGEDVYLQLHAFDKDHGKELPRSTAIALLTDQLPGWYNYIQEQNVPVKYTYKPREGGPHDGFVAVDPGGYLLEFEQFKQHPQNERFIAVLADLNPVKTSIRDFEFYGSITWTYHRDLLLMQEFYEQVLGYRLVADQGWTKIYQASSSGFIGLVDECRGMEDYADEKAVELEWAVTNSNSFTPYAEKHWNAYRYKGDRFVGPENYNYRISPASKN